MADQPEGRTSALRSSPAAQAATTWTWQGTTEFSIAARGHLLALATVAGLMRESAGRP